MNGPIRVIAATIVFTVLARETCGQNVAQTPEAVRISGRVVDTCGAPIQQATVKLLRSGTIEIVRTTKTDSDGDFAFSPLSPKTYDVRIEALDGQPFVKTIDASGRSEIEVDAVVELAPVRPTSSPLVRYQSIPILGSPSVPSSPQSSGASNQPESSGPMKTTLCEAVTDWKQFSGRVVQIRARIRPVVIDTPLVLFDDACPQRARLLFDEQSNRDYEYRLLERYLVESRIVEATLSGKFEHWFVRFGKEEYRFTLQTVSGVVPKSVGS